MGKETVTINGVPTIDKKRVDHYIVFPESVISQGVGDLSSCLKCETVGRILHHGLVRSKDVVCTPNFEQPQNTLVTVGEDNRTWGWCNLILGLRHQPLVDQTETPGD